MSQDWHWLDKQGVQRVATAQLLNDAILHGVVSADAPVWQPGMSTFVPASRLPAFTDACKHAGSKRNEGVVPPPPGSPAAPNPEAMAALQRTLDQAKGKRVGSRAAPPAPAAAKSGAPTQRLGSIRSADTARRPLRSSKPEEAPKAGTLLGIPFMPATPSPLPPVAPPPGALPALRAEAPPPPAPDEPPGPPLAPVPDAADPTAPRTEPPPAIASVEVDRFEDTPPATPMARDSRRVDQPSGSTPVPQPMPPLPDLSAGSGVDLVAVPIRRSNPSLDADAPSVIVPPPSVRPPEPPTRPPEPSRADQTLRTKAIRPRRFLYPVIGVVAGIALLGIVGLPMRACRSESPTKPVASSTATAPARVTASVAPAASSAAAPAVPAAAISTDPCTFRGTRKRIVVGASKDVPIEVWARSDYPLVAAGFAAKNGSALGFVLDPKTLEPKKTFSEKAAAAVRRVVPARAGDAITFAVDTDDPQAALKNTLTVASTPPLKLGTFKDALTIEAIDSTVPDVLWTLPTSKPLEAMRAVAVPSRGMAVVFRSDDGVWLGWVSEDRKANGKLTRIPGTGVQVGTPSIGWNGREVLVAVADLPAHDAAWAIRLARVAYGGEPTASEPWEVPAGGPGGPAIAPSVFGLDDGRWLVVWTEGKSGSRDVRVQTYDASMHALGDAFTVSDAGSNAGQGVAAVSNAGGVVMYLSVLGKMYEVWGAAIDCP